MVKKELKHPDCGLKVSWTNQSPLSWFAQFLTHLSSWGVGGTALSQAESLNTARASYDYTHPSPGQHLSLSLSHNFTHRKSTELNFANQKKAPKLGLGKSEVVKP